MTALSEFTLDELTALVETMGEPKYRAKQLMRHIVAFDSYDEYTDIPKALIEKLKSQYADRAVREKTRVTAADGAVRYLFELTDGDLAEAVFLPHEYGNSVCVSCQVGCAMGCVFCASGYYGLKRNLSAGEILAQALYIARDKKSRGRQQNSNDGERFAARQLRQYGQIRQAYHRQRRVKHRYAFDFRIDVRASRQNRTARRRRVYGNAVAVAARRHRR